MMNIIVTILLFLSLVLDFLLSNFIPFAFNDITFIYPMFFVATNIVLCKYLNKNNVYIFLLFVIIYSSLAFNNIILGIIVYAVIYAFNRFTDKIAIYLRLGLSIVLYDLLLYTILIIFKGYDLNIIFYWYKLSRSIIFNLIYMIIFNLVLKKINP